MIDNKKYTLNDANELVNKIAKQKIGKNNAIKTYNNLVDNAKKNRKCKIYSTQTRNVRNI